MVTSEERMRILKMIEDGKITAEEGARLLAALSEKGETRRRTLGGTARWLRIRVTDTKSGKPKASIQLPLSLVDAGLKIGAHFAPEVAGLDMEAIMEALRNDVSGKIIDVVDEEDGERVEISIE